MAKLSAKDVALLLIDQYDVRGISTELSEAVEPVLQPTTPFGVVWPELGDTGHRRGEFSAAHFLDDATASILDALLNQEGVSRIMFYSLEGNAYGAECVGLQGALMGKFTRTVEMEAFCRAKGDWSVSGQVDRGGIILHILQAETANGNTEGANSQDNGASSAAGAVAYMAVPAITLGTATNLAAKVRHSADDVTYADLITFDVVTVGAGRAQRKTSAGTVNRHLATSWAWTGGAGGGSTATFVIGVKRG